MSITRFAILSDERRLLLGIDKAMLFEPGYVYEAIEVMGEIVMRKLDKYALPAQGIHPCELSVPEDIIYSGQHLITKQEQAAIAAWSEDKSSL